MRRSHGGRRAAAGCPHFAARTIPTDGTPLRPSPDTRGMAGRGGATRLQYSDGHEGWIVTRHELARAVLEDSRFSQQPQRMPGVGPDSRTRTVELLAALGREHPCSRCARAPADPPRTAAPTFGQGGARVRSGCRRDRRPPAGQLPRGRVRRRTYGRISRSRSRRRCTAGCSASPMTTPPSSRELFVGESTIAQKVAFVRAVLAAKRAAGRGSCSAIS